MSFKLEIASKLTIYTFITAVRLMIRMMLLIIGKAPGVLSYVGEIPEIGFEALGVVETPSKVNASWFSIGNMSLHICWQYKVNHQFILVAIVEALEVFFCQ